MRFRFAPPARFSAALPALLLASLPVAGRAQSRGGEDPCRPESSCLSADVEARGEYTDNVLLTPETGKKGADQILVANPSLEAKSVTRGLRASLKYELNYFHYSKHDDLDRALHDLDARASLIYWESLDLEASELLAPQPLSWASPLRDPVNDVQASHSSGHAGLHHEFGRNTRASLGYRGEYVTYVEVHKNDPKLPEYTVHGPELTAERDLGPLSTLGVLYSFRVQTYATPKVGPKSPDWQGHVAELELRSAPTEWLGLHARGGFKSITYVDAKVNRTRVVADGSAVAGGDLARVDLSILHDTTQDVVGNPATVSRATLGAEYSPNAPWSARISGGYGALHYDVPVTTALTLGSTQGFFEGGAGLTYRFATVGVLTIGATHHESTTKVDSLTGESKIVVNRGTVSLGGKF